jgi:CubicO group peptidase (beta-lactamase class C family)
MQTRSVPGCSLRDATTPTLRRQARGGEQSLQPRRRTTRGYGQEVTFCCFNAVLRDYARLGRLLAHDGAWEGRQLIPRQWLIDATTLRTGPADAYLAPGTATPYYGYGYQVWLLPGGQRRFALLGIRGQIIFVDPVSKLVMVHTAVRPKPADPAANAETVALWTGVVQQLGGEGERR